MFLFLDCLSGYYGSNCSNSCRYPSYGVDCQEECHCPKKVCDHVFGCSNYVLNGKYGVGEKERERDMLRVFFLSDIAIFENTSTIKRVMTNK